MALFQRLRCELFAEDVGGPVDLVLALLPGTVRAACTALPIAVAIASLLKPDVLVGIFWLASKPFLEWFPVACLPTLLELTKLLGPTQRRLRAYLAPEVIAYSTRMYFRTGAFATATLREERQHENNAMGARKVIRRLLL